MGFSIVKLQILFSEAKSLLVSPSESLSSQFPMENFAATATPGGHELLWPFRLVTIDYIQYNIMLYYGQ